MIWGAYSSGHWVAFRAAHMHAGPDYAQCNATHDRAAHETEGSTLLVIYNHLK